MVDITGVLSLSCFCLTNIKTLSLLLSGYPFSLPSHAGNTFLIGFMFYQCLLGVVTHKKCDETRVFLVYTWRHQKSNWETIDSSEFLLSGFKVQVYFALFKLIQYKLAYRITKLTKMMKNKINITYNFVDMYTVTKVAEAFMLVTVPFYNGLLYYRGVHYKTVR